MQAAAVSTSLQCSNEHLACVGSTMIQVTSLVLMMTMCADSQDVYCLYRVRHFKHHMQGRVRVTFDKSTNACSSCDGQLMYVRPIIATLVTSTIRFVSDLC